MIKLIKDISSDQLSWRNDPLIHQWTRQNGLLNDHEHERWLQRIQTDPTVKFFGIEDESNNLNIGTCGLTSISPIHGTAEFSLFIAPEYQRRGYGKEALIELLKYGFKHLRLHCIWGETIIGNPAYELFTKLGLVPEGSLRQRYFKNGDYQSTKLLSILEEEARAQSWWE